MARRHFLLLSLLLAACAVSSGGTNLVCARRAAAAAARAAQSAAAASGVPAGTVAGPQPVYAPLVGCPFTDFSIPVRVGDTWFQLTVDTGSSTLAVAGASCAECSIVSPLWTASETSTNLSLTTSSSYYDQSSWSGHVWHDRVAIGSASDEADELLAAVSMRLAVMNQQTSFFSTLSCDLTESGLGFEFGESSKHGILGLAYASLASPHTDSFMHQLFLAQPTLLKQFALSMCWDHGQLWIGGIDNTTYTGEMLYTPIIDESYYVISVADIRVNGTSLHSTPADWTVDSQASIVDSGSTTLELPTAIFRKVVDTIIANEAFQRYFRHASDDNLFDHPGQECQAASLNATRAELQEVLPTLAIRMENGLQLTMDGVGSYLLPCDNSSTLWTTGLMSTSRGMTGGWSLMNQFVTVFDVAERRIGFAASTACEQTTLRTAVTWSDPTVNRTDEREGARMVLADEERGNFSLPEIESE